MSMRTPIRFTLAAAAVALLGACASAPQPLQGAFPAVTPEQAVAGQQVGANVRWGGRIVQTLPGPDSTCFQVVAIPLGASGRPVSGAAADAAQGRFIACRTGFYDPALFTADREVTFTGRIAATEQVQIGEYDYRLPRVDADVVYLWPERADVQVIRYEPYPWGWGPGWWW